MAVEGWIEKELGDIADVNWGNTNLTKSSYTESGFPAFSATGPDGLISKYEHESDGVVLSAIGARCGRCFFASGKWTAIKNTITIKNEEEKSDIKFLYHYLNREGVWPISGGAQPFIGLGNARKLKLLLPPIKEQKKIAEILERVDDAIAKTENVIAQTQRVKQGLLQQLLTRGIGHTKFKQTELGEIPESWDVLPIGDIVTFYNGKAHEQDISEEGSHVVVNSKFISTEGEVRKFTNSPSLIAHSNDVLIVMSDIPNGKAIAKCFYVDQDNLYTVNQRIGLLRSKKDDPKFLFYTLNRNSYFLSFDDGAKQTNLRKDEVLACPIALPKDVTEQRKISGCLSEIDTLIKSTNLDLSALNSLKTGLMSDLLTGRVRVQVDTKTLNKIEEAA